MGDSGDYEVEIQAVSGQPGLTFRCDCPHADEGNFCKHMVAAGLELARYLEDGEWDEEDDDEPYTRPPAARTALRAARTTSRPARAWRNKLDEALDAGQYRSSASRALRYVGLVVLERQDYYAYSYGYGYPSRTDAPYTLTPYVVPAADWPALAGSQPGPDRTAINAMLETDRKWIKAGRAIAQTACPCCCLCWRSLTCLCSRELRTASGSNAVCASRPIWRKWRLTCAPRMTASGS